MNGWPTLTVSDIAAPGPRSIAIGPFGSRMKADTYVPSGVPVVRGNNIVKTRNPSGEFVYIAEEFANTMPGSILRAGDLVFPHRGAIGEVGLIDGDANTKMMLSTSLMKLTPDPSRMDSAYVYYYFKSAIGRGQLMMRASTVGTPGIGQPLSSLRSIPIPVPPLMEQRGIAATLGSIDDRIESNRRAEILCLRVAQALFEQSATTVETVRLGDVANLVLGGTPDRKRDEFWGGGTVPWINSGAANQDIVLEASEFITEAGLQRSAAKLMPVGATVVAITGATLGQVALLGLNTSGNQSLVGIWAGSRAMTAWLHFAVKSAIPELLGAATGAAQQHVNKANIADLRVPLASPSSVDAWASVAVPLLDRALGLGCESRRLESLRDALIPALLSGRIRVSEAQEAVA